MFRVPESAMRILTPLSEMTCYQWGSGTATDYFCPVCGILPFRRPSKLTATEVEKGVEPFSGWAVNVRCLKGVDLKTLPVAWIEGSKIQLPN